MNFNRAKLKEDRMVEIDPNGEIIDLKDMLRVLDFLETTNFFICCTHQDSETDSKICISGSYK